MAVPLTSIRLDTKLADKAVRVLGAKSRTEAVHVALRACLRSPKQQPEKRQVDHLQAGVQFAFAVLP
jgi:Arc/MetJ family transcription regulator